jgi:hypothetical protein
VLAASIGAGAIAAGQAILFAFSVLGAWTEGGPRQAAIQALTLLIVLFLDAQVLTEVGKRIGLSRPMPRARSRAGARKVLAVAFFSVPRR